MKRSAPKVCVVGSINMDLVVRCARLPAPGETVLAEGSAEFCGGKGANQAVAAARAGGEVTFVGRVGDDELARRLLANLQLEGVDYRRVQATPQCASGLAVVAVEQSGQNAILVVPGANGRLGVEDVEAARSDIEGGDVLLVQLEAPIEAVCAAARIAAAANVRVVLDPAPAPRELPEELFQVDLLCPNQTEAATLLGHEVDSPSAAHAAAEELRRRGVGNVAITLGEYGTVLATSTETMLIAPFPVTAVDSTAAGDAFAGALAVLWAEQNDLPQAVRLANAAGAISALRVGAQPSMASRAEIETLEKNRP